MDPVSLVDEHGGLLVFDGVVLEHFDHRNRTSQFRIHGRHLDRFEFQDHGKGTFALRSYVSRKTQHPVVFSDDQRPEVEQFVAVVERARTDLGGPLPA